MTFAIRIPAIAALTAIAMPAMAQEVNLYSYRQPELLAPLTDAFTEETGIKVNVAHLEDGMVERLKAEGARSPADLVLTVDIARIYELFPRLKERRRNMGNQLSGGEQQMLAIGRALMTNPELLILDEATEGIQPNIVHEIGDIILKLNEETGVTVLLVEQKLPFARRVASDFRILDKGRSVSGGAISELNDNDIREHLTV